MRSSKEDLHRTSLTGALNDAARCTASSNAGLLGRPKYGLAEEPSWYFILLIPTLIFSKNKSQKRGQRFPKEHIPPPIRVPLREIEKTELKAES